jgi:hypothetical protein
MMALAGRAARAGLALVLALLTLAVARWPPVHARVPWDVRALPLFPLAVGCAVVAAVTGSAARRGSSRLPRAPVLFLILAAALFSLAAVVALRPPADCGRGARAGAFRPAARGRDRGQRAAPARAAVRAPADLPLARPAAGPAHRHYRLWATGRGRVEVGWTAASCSRAKATRCAGADTRLGAGEHALAVTSIAWRRAAAGPGLTRPTVPARRCPCDRWAPAGQRGG